MALQVWLPLNGTLENKGISNVVATNNGATVNTSGKIGSCYTFNGSNNYMRANYPASNYIQNMSFCCWVKLNNITTNMTLISSRKSTGYGMSVFILSGKIRFDNGQDSSQSQTTFSTSLIANTWQHICVVQNATNRQLYINGVLKETISATTPITNTAQYLLIGGSSSSDSTPTGNWLNGYLNDVRIYNHCLSAMEVKKISQGLVGHYLLSAPSISLAKYDILEYIQVSGGAYVQTDYIANTDKHKCEFKVSLLSASGWHGPFGCYTDENTKAFRLLMKSGSSTDIGLWHYRRAGAGGGPYVTAITAWDQILEGSMDKTTYSITNLSTSNTFTGSINNGTDGSTNTGALTINNSGGSKSSNKVYYLRIYENNILIHYYVPVKQKETNTLGYFDVITQKFWPRTGTSGTMTAGPVINTFSIISKDDLNVYDCSGYNNNGLSNKTIDFIMPSPRYDSAMKFNGSNDAIKIPFNDMIKSDFTFSIWFYKSVIGSKNYQTILGGPSGFELELRNSSGTDPLVTLWNWGKATTAYEFNKWNHLVFIRNTSASKVDVYLNGEFKITGSVGSLPSGNYFIGAWSSATGQNFQGNAVDARLYATALSASDVLELYNTSMIVNSDGTISPRVLTS